MWTRTEKTESRTHLQWEEDNLFFSRNLLYFRRHRKCNLFSAHFSNCLYHYDRTAETRELSPTLPAPLPSRLFTADKQTESSWRSNDIHAAKPWHKEIALPTGQKNPERKQPVANILERKLRDWRDSLDEFNNLFL